MSRLTPKIGGPLSERFFTSDQVALLTGISPEKQRTLRSRDLIPFEGDVEPIRRERSRLVTWNIVMKWALLAEVTKFGIDTKSAANFANAECFDNMAYFDFTREGEPPLYAFCRPKAGDPESFKDVTTGSGEIAFDDSRFWGRFFFGIDYSELQRTVLKRLEAL